jgi:hypothetical protein
MIAGLIGPAWLRSRPPCHSLFPCIGAAGLSRPRAHLLSGILLFVAGLAIVRAHNVWAGGWPVLVTAIGWLILLGGLARMLFLTQIAAMAAGIGRSTGLIIGDVEPISNPLRSFVEIRARADWAIVPSAIHAHQVDQLRETRQSQTDSVCSMAPTISRAASDSSVVGPRERAPKAESRMRMLTV